MGHTFGKAKVDDSDRRGVHQGTARPDDRQDDHRDDAAGQ